MKLRPYSGYEDGKPSGETAGYHHWCPACHEPHGIAVTHRNRSGAVWQFNGNLERPTFTPSVRCFTMDTENDCGAPLPLPVQRTLCHYFITEGMIVFCGDNPHALNGQTVPLPDWPQNRM